MNRSPSTPPLLACIVALALSLQVDPPRSHAAPLPDARAPDPRPLGDLLWDLATIYRDDSNPVLQQISLRGQVDLQWVTGQSRAGTFGTDDIPDALTWGDVEVRRNRYGIATRWFRDFQVVTRADFGPECDPFYLGIYDCYLQYSKGPSLDLRLGKVKPKHFTHEYFLGTDELPVIERSPIVSTIVPPTLTGLRAESILDGWHAALGLYAGDASAEFTRADAGLVGHLSLGYDLGPILHLQSAVAKIDYQYSSSTENGLGPGHFGHAIDLNLDLRHDRLGIAADLIGALASDRGSDVAGVILTPTYLLAPSVELVLRLLYEHGQDGTLRPQLRYESHLADSTPLATGENHASAYLGVNWLVHGKKLKLMTALELFTNDREEADAVNDGAIFWAGVRFQF